MPKAATKKSSSNTRVFSVPGMQGLSRRVQVLVIAVIVGVLGVGGMFGFGAYRDRVAHAGSNAYVWSPNGQLGVGYCASAYGTFRTYSINLSPYSATMYYPGGSRTVSAHTSSGYVYASNGSSVRRVAL